MLTVFLVDVDVDVDNILFNNVVNVAFIADIAVAALFDQIVALIKNTSHLYTNTRDLFTNTSD
jgi:hypothetical protein